MCSTGDLCGGGGERSGGCGGLPPASRAVRPFLPFPFTSLHSYAVINCCCCVSDRSSVRCRLSNKERIICNKELHKSVRQFPRAFVWFAADGTVQGCLRCQTEDTIDWSRTGLTAVDMTTVSLAIRCSWARCTSLQLSHNAIGDEGIALLASALLPFRLPHLETLEIEECRVTENVT